MKRFLVCCLLVMFVVSVGCSGLPSAGGRTNMGDSKEQREGETGGDAGAGDK